MYWYLVGITAAMLTTFGFVPQILKMYRTKSVTDVSIVTFFQYAAGTAIWTLYSFHLNDPVMIVSNIVALIILVTAIVLYYNLSNNLSNKEKESNDVL